MNLTIVYSITEYLARAVTVAYKKAKKDVAGSNRKNIAGFSDKLPSYLSIDFNDTDKKLLRNFEQECFTVACIGSYELEEKLKQAAIEILNKPESDTGNRFEAFVKEARNLMDGYLPPKDGKAPQTGWLKTNFQTAVSSAYNASQWQMLHDPAIAGLYPAYQYKTREDARVRDEHRALNNSVYRAHDDIWKSIYPPNGWNCRCYIKYLSQDEIRQPGNEPIDLSPEMRTELIKQAKIHPDFNRNSGITGHIFDKWKNSKLPDLPEKIQKSIREYADNFASSIHSAGLNIADADEDARELIEPVQYYPKAMYDSMPHKPFEYYFRNSDQVYSTGNQLFFGMKAFKSDMITGFLHLEEFIHAYFYEHKLILDDYVDPRIMKSFEKAKKLFEQNSKELIATFSDLNFKTIVADIVTQKGLAKIDAEFLTKNVGDYIFSVSDLKAGYGHDADYMKRHNNSIKEWSVRQYILANEKTLTFNTHFLFQQHLSMFEPINKELLNIINSTNEPKKKKGR